MRDPRDIIIEYGRREDAWFNVDLLGMATIAGILLLGMAAASWASDAKADLIQACMADKAEAAPDGTDYKTDYETHYSECVKELQ